MDDTSQAIHESAIVIDGLEISRFGRPVFERMRRGGLTAVNCTVSVLENFRQTVKNIVWWQRAFDEYADLIIPVSSTNDIRTAKKTDKTSIQNAAEFGNLTHALHPARRRCKYSE